MNAPRITREHIEALRLKLHYVFEQPQGTTSTFCHVYLPGKEGRMFYLATGTSACVSPENFNSSIGIDIARSKAGQLAADKLWELEGYALFKELDNE